MLQPHLLRYDPVQPRPLTSQQLTGISQGSDAKSSPKASTLSFIFPEPANIWSLGLIPTSPPHCHISWPDGLTPTPLEQLSLASLYPVTTYY